MVVCNFDNCNKQAYYAQYYAKPLRCKEHKENYKKQYKICVCGKHQPSLNYKGEKPMYCKLCKKKNMINVKDKKCYCGKAIPTFNHEGKKIATHCFKCKEDGMIRLNKHKKCYCGKSIPSFNFKGKSRKYCKDCKLKGMIYVNTKLCECGSYPIYNLPGKKAKYCNKCKKDGMIRIKKCKKCKCGSATPSFNIKGLPAKYCKLCKTDDMINVYNILCKCGNRARYNEENKKPKYCIKCKTENMVNLLDKKCIGQEGLCPTIGNKKYKGYCTHCFAHYFPKDPLTFQIRSKTKEIAVRDFINANYENFQHDEPLWLPGCDCTHKRRIDHRILINNTLLCIETDENQHKYYDQSDNDVRYNDLYMIHSGKFIFIRYNPDKYKNKKGQIKNPQIKSRLTVLKQEIDKQILRIQNGDNIDLLDIIYLYYDNFN